MCCVFIWFVSLTLIRDRNRVCARLMLYFECVRANCTCENRTHTHHTCISARSLLVYVYVLVYVRDMRVCMRICVYE